MKRKVSIWAILSLVVLMVVGCSYSKAPLAQEEPTATAEETPDKLHTPKDYMVIAMVKPTTLHPLYSTEPSAQQALNLIFSSLINIEENGTISSNLAESWVINETNTAVTITLKQGIKWHDGTSLTTDDVIYTLNQISAIVDSPYKEAVNNIQSLVKIDETTFKIVYKQSFSGILQTLFFPVIPKHIYDVTGEETLEVIPVGTGPYVYDSTIPLKCIKLKANENYFKGKPSISNVEIDFIPDQESMLYAFKQGLIDVIYTDETEWGKYTNDEASTAYEMAAPIYEFMGLNHSKVIFQNVAVREALLYGMNREEMVHLFYLDHALVTDTPISPASYLYDNTLETIGYDKEKSKLLLTQEGYVKDTSTGLMTKNEVELSFTLLVNNENKDRLKVAEQIQKMYKDIGIKMEIERVDKSEYIQRIQTRQYDAFLGGYQLSYATDLSFALHSASVLSGENYVGYQDKTMDEYLQQAFLATPKNVNERYGQLQHYFVKQMPFISLYFKNTVMITCNDIGGNIQPKPYNIFATVEKWRRE